MARFNPFAKVGGSRGAPMGRHGCAPEAFIDIPGKLYARHCGGGGYYDRGGAYWGHSKVCAVWSRGGELCAYVEAYTPAEALRIVRKAVDEARGPETTRVLFRVARDGEVTAVFPDQRESPRAQLFACYAHVGQHGSCDEAWVREDTRPAKPTEYAALKAELEAEPYGYELVVMARIDRSCFA